MSSFLDVLTGRSDNKFGKPAVEMSGSGVSVGNMTGAPDDPRGQNVLAADMKGSSAYNMQRERALAAKAQAEARRAMEEARRQKEETKKSPFLKREEPVEEEKPVQPVETKPEVKTRPSAFAQQSMRPGAVQRTNDTAEATADAASADSMVRRPYANRNKSSATVAAERAQLEFNAAKTRESRAIQEAVDAAAKAEEARAAVTKAEEIREAAVNAETEAAAAAKVGPRLKLLCI